MISDVNWIVEALLSMKHRVGKTSCWFFFLHWNRRIRYIKIRAFFSDRQVDHSSAVLLSRFQPSTQTCLFKSALSSSCHSPSPLHHLVCSRLAFPASTVQKPHFDALFTPSPGSRSDPHIQVQQALKRVIKGAGLSFGSFVQLFCLRSCIFEFRLK